MILIYLDIPDQWRQWAKYAFNALAMRWSIPIGFSDSADKAHIRYTAKAAGLGFEAVTIPFDAEIYDPKTVCRALESPSGRWLWAKVAVSDIAATDLIGGIFRLLTCLDESQIDESKRDRRGIFLNPALPESRHRMAGEPLVEDHAAEILGEIISRFPDLERAKIPRWPDGKHLAVSLTHDVDALHLGALLELAANFSKGLLRRNMNQMRLLALGLAYLGQKSRNPFFAFGRWREWEAQRDLRSAFYLFHLPPGAKRDLNDCRSGIAGGGTDWKLLRQMARDGWEFGLHPSINTKDLPDGFAVSKRWLEEQLGVEISGIRHHFWALDWRKPYETQRLHMQAGYKYDSTIGWRDEAGFRAGTSLPYQPYDLSANTSLNITEIPCNIMDGYYLPSAVDKFTPDIESAVAKARAIIDRIRAQGGVVMLNWHQESACARLHYTNHLSMLDKLIEPLRHDSDIWFTPPIEICRRWEYLTSKLTA